MKIRYLAAVFTVFMGIVLAYFLLVTGQNEQAALDMVYYNKELKEISEAVRSGIEKENLEAEYDCSLLFLTDEDYKSRLNEALLKGYVILDYEEDGQVAGKVIWDRESRLYQTWKSRMRREIVIFWSTMLAAGYLLLTILYLRFVRPFRQLQVFSAEIAKGNLDLPLPMYKHNFFGAFTESFDIMREELKKARESEYLANVSKKELVAELSHDIKTPVAAIKATCEVMEVKEKNADTLEKIKVIETKADTIDHLIGNMFHATMEELQVLKVRACEESSTLIPGMFENLKYYGDIIIENEIAGCLIYMDKIRLEQVIDNIVNNSFKYAKTPVRVSFGETEEGISIMVRDEGPGVASAELALVTEKFYRGSNAKGESGSGLGLYLAKNFMEQMKGGMECFVEKGFVVNLFLSKV
ncbi:MAG: HAMP domain-containing histidine kinase [Lachnospiraceae bacterium]|nr:HAMP domain-containing histidine kinase [Lachnospiraceae bacterium]